MLYKKLKRKFKNQRKYYWKNKKKILKQQKIYEKLNRKKISKRKLGYYHRKGKFKAGHWYRSIKTRAKKYNHKFNITFNFFKENLWKKPCFYCGNNENRNGVDRINSKKGYLKNNCVSCCKKCNWAKNDLTIEEFLKHCNKIINYQKRISAIMQKVRI